MSKEDEEMKYQFARWRWFTGGRIGHDLVPIRCLGIDGQIWFETASVSKVVFYLLK